MTWLTRTFSALWGYLAAALAGVLAILAALAYARSQGRQGERSRAKELDRERANQIRDAVDAARRGGGLQPDDRGYRD
jgi:type II secretory pathway pseudopilin PulG